MKKFFQSVFTFLQMLFTNVESFTQKHILPSIEVVNNIKTVVESPVVDILTAIIPGTWDDAIKDFVRANIQKVLTLMNITADIASDPDPASQLAKLVEYLKNASAPMQAAIYKQLASELSKASANGKEEYKGQAVDLLLQIAYSKLKSGVKEEDLHIAQ